MVGASTGLEPLRFRPGFPLATTSDGIGLASIWIGGGAPTGSGSGSSNLDAGVAWIEAHGAPGAPQLIPYREGGWVLCSQCAVNSQLGE